MAKPVETTVTERAEQNCLAELQRSGLFDGGWFVARNPDLQGGSHAALVHWHRYGWQEGRWPNPYFDPDHYRARNPGCTGDPLLHYIQEGEAAGARPVLHFDPAWYRGRYGSRSASSAWPTSCATATPATSAPSPSSTPRSTCGRTRTWRRPGWTRCEHYLVRGFSEGRTPCPGYDPRRWKGGALHPNPLLGLLLWREQSRLDGAAPNIPAEVRRTTRPNAAFEEVAALPPGVQPQAKLLAYYLPQYHPSPENDAWWGRGFTEWTNLARALPRFAGHYQPRIPRDLGHYRLDRPDTLRRQIALAKGAGLHGFVFYFYWFNGRRLLEAPIEALLADRSAGHAVLPDVGQRELDPAVGRVGRPGAAQPGLPHRGRAGADRGVRPPLRRPALHPAGRPPGADGLPRPPDPGHGGHHRALARAVPGRPWRGPGLRHGAELRRHRPAPLGMDAAVEFPPHKLTERCR